MPSTLSAQAIVQRVYDETNQELDGTFVATASAYSAPANYSMQSVLQRVFDDSTSRIRLVTT